MGVMEGEVLLAEVQPPSAVEPLRRLHGEAESVDISRYGEPPSEDAPEMRRHQMTLHWLAYVLIVTAVLLVFQVALGVFANSLALLADSSHSTLDVISYGLNYFVEKWKMRNRGGYKELNTESCVAKVDLVGGIVSTLTLVAATGLAVHEAIVRLGGESSADEHEFENIGEVLLLFAVVSTLANVLLLVYYAKQQSQLNQLSVPLPVAAPPESYGARKDPGSAFPLLPIPALHPMDLESSLALIDAPAVPAIANGQSRQNRRAKNKSTLNLSHAYSAQGACASDCNQNGCSHNGCSDDCTHINCSQSANSPSVSRGNPRSNWFSLLHVLIHPGCNDTADSVAGADSSCCGKSHEKHENLNLTAAMLHLIADVVRGITILISALMIQSGMVKDAGKADAVCALLVALFILIGAVAIFQRVANSVCKTN